MRGIVKKVDENDERLRPSSAIESSPHDPIHEPGSCNRCAVWRNAARREQSIADYLKSIRTEEGKK